MYKFDTSGFNVDQFADKVNAAIDKAVNEAVLNIVQDAKAGDADLPTIAASISGGKVEANRYEILKGEGMERPELAAYSEFGTGNFAATLLAPYPDDWKAMAMDYYVNGKGILSSKPSLYQAFSKHTVNIVDKVIEWL